MENWIAPKHESQPKLQLIWWWFAFKIWKIIRLKYKIKGQNERQCSATVKINTKKEKCSIQYLDFETSTCNLKEKPIENCKKQPKKERKNGKQGMENLQTLILLYFCINFKPWKNSYMDKLFVIAPFKMDTSTFCFKVNYRKM